MAVTDYKTHIRLIIPNCFTGLNICCGFLAIWQMTEGHFLAAAWLIIVAVMFDMADGKLARYMGLESDFGFQLDSMADLITSGLAPAVMVLYAGPSWTVMRVTGAMIFVLASAYRLARFNVIEKNERHKMYFGLPAPVAAYTIVGLWFFKWQSAISHDILWTVTLVALPLLMVSRIPFKWPRVTFKEGAREGVFSIVKLGLTAAMVVFPGTFIFPLFAAYAARGVVLSLFDHRSI